MYKRAIVPRENIAIRKRGIKHIILGLSDGNVPLLKKFMYDEKICSL